MKGTDGTAASKRGTIGCITFSYGISLLLLSASWFGPPPGYGNWHGLRVLFSPDLVYTTGTVIRYDSSRMGTRSSHTPVIEFLVHNRPMRFSGVGREKQVFNVGERVPIAYRKSDPETVHIRTFDQQYSLPLMMILFASPFLLIAFWGTFKAIRNPGSTRVGE